MKVAVLFGSPDNNGFTEILLREYISTLPQDSIIRRFDAYASAPAPCIGCGHCSEADQCIYDDLDELFSAIFDCELLVIASPVYYLSFPAPLKAIIDRVQRFHEAEQRKATQPAKGQRRCTVLLTAGSKSETGDVIRRQLKWVAGPLGITDIKMLVCADTDRQTKQSFAERVKKVISDNMEF